MRGPGDILRVASRRYGDKTALITAGRSFGYAELDDLAAQAAARLRAAGVQPGQVVSLYGPNSWQWVLAYHAILRAGAVVNPINVMLTPPEVAFILRDCGSVAMLASQAQLPVLSELAEGIKTVRCVRGLDSDGEDGFATLFGTPPWPARLRSTQPGCPPSATPPAPPGTRKTRCNRTGLYWSTAR
jgi:long-chain acyl-CoA synthetase